MKKVVEYLPIISALLLFVGFINYSTFYRFFDIEIVNYLTSGELLLSFLPLTMPILLVAILLSIVFIIYIIPDTGGTPRLESSTEKVNLLSIYLANDTYKIIKPILKSNFTIRTFLLLLILISIFLFGIFVIIFFSLTPLLLIPLSVDLKLFPEWDPSVIILISSTWFLILFDMISKIGKKSTSQFVGWINTIYMVIAFIYFITLSNKIKATEILRGKPNYSVKFEFQGKTVTTDSNIVFIGRTSNYLFLRNLSQKSNLVYQCSEIMFIEFYKILQK